MKPSELSPKRWRLIDGILEEALDLPPTDRADFLDRACVHDAELRASVEELLEAHARADERLREPASELGAALLGALDRPESVGGRRIGPFRLVREIGRGGMGVVYLAEDSRLPRMVALKALPPFLGTGPAARRRFVTEARAVGGLDHPNVATLYEIDATEDGQLYMAFAFYEGETLEERLRRGPIPPDAAARITREVAAGLAAAHEAGVVHRDIKPSNVLLGESGAVKLLDFGVAKLVGEDLTADGSPLGTVTYMSPEQVRGEPLDGRTDLWSLGVVFYEMLTARRPFQGDELGSVLRSIVEDDPPRPSELTPGLPESLERIVGRLLHKNRGDRYGTAKELGTELAAWEEGALQAHSQPSPWPTNAFARGPRRFSIWGRVGAGVAVVAAAASIALGRGGGTESPQSLPSIDRLAVLPFANLTGDSTRQHIVEGLHDALTRELSAVGTVGVVSRSSVMSFDVGDRTLVEIARGLGVDAVVQASVLNRDDSLTVSVELTDATSGERIWSGTFEDDLGAAFDVAGRIARAVSVRLEVPISPAAEAHLAMQRRVDPRAYDAYAHALFSLSRGNAEGFALAERYLLQAIDADSSFALAYVDLAEVRGRAAFFGLRDPSEILPSVSSLLDLAVGMDSTIALTHTRRAHVDLFWNRNVADAERAARRALELDPNLVAGYFSLSEAMAVQGEYDRALALAERGSELAPWDEFASVRPSLALYYMRDFERAIEGVREAIDFFPEFWQGHWILCMSLAGAGRADEAVESCEQAVARSGRATMALAGLGYVHAVSGNTEAARAIVRELEAPPRGTYVAPMDVAMVHAGLGDHDGAFLWLDRAERGRDLRLMQVRNHAPFDGLHADPRFTSLTERLGLATG